MLAEGGRLPRGQRGAGGQRTVGDLLQMSRWSEWPGMNVTDCTLSSDAVGGAKVHTHSHDFASHTRTDPSLEPETIFAPSGA